MRIRLIAAVAVVAAFVAACGNSPAATPTGATASTPAPQTAAPTAAPATTAPTSPSTSGAREEVVAAAAATIAKTTVSIEQTIEFNGNAQIPDGTTASIVGGTAFTKPTQLAAAADFGGLGLGTFDMIVDDQLVYLRGEIVEEAVGAGKWLLVDLRSDDPRAAGFKDLASGQNDSSLLLYFLYGAQEPVTALPDEALGGQPMRRFSMPVDLDAAIAAAPAEARESLEANVEALTTGGLSTTVQGDVWIGADGLVHRVDYEYTLGAASGGGTMLVTCVFTEFGAPLDLGVPADADVVALEDL